MRYCPHPMPILLPTFLVVLAFLSVLIRDAVLASEPEVLVDGKLAQARVAGSEDGEPNDDA